MSQLDDQSSLRSEEAAAWRGADLKDRQEWQRRFSTQEIEELEAALAACSHLALEEITRERFPLPRLSRALQGVYEEVVFGRGFILLRGLPLDSWTREQAARAYYGIGCHVGLPVPQNGAGHLLGHVKDLGIDPKNPANRIYQTSARQVFHTDSCDIVGLLCLQKSKSGGLSAIVSSTSIFRELQRRRPDLAEVLCEDFIVDRKGEIPEGKGPHYKLPVFHLYDGWTTCIYARDFIEAAQERFADIPRLTDKQIEAMDLMDQLANDPSLRLDMAFEPGDIQLLHNHQILHARSAYEDWPEPHRKRHLLRLWLSTPNGRALPPGFAERYGTVEPGQIRGGIRTPGQKLSAPLDV